VQTGTINEKDIKWDNTNVQLNDVFDYDWESTHKATKLEPNNRGQQQINQFDGLVHAQGKAFDATTG
jgi:hypothetical protein